MTLHRGAGLWIGLAAAITALALGGCGGARARYNSHLQRGQQYLADGNLDKASVEFRNAAQIEPKETEPAYFKGRVAEAQGNLRDAVLLYRTALEGNHGYEAARARLSKLLVFAGAAAETLETVAPGLSAKPDDPDLLAARAIARHELQQEHAARADAEHAIRVAPANENAVAALATLYADAKDYEHAVALVSRAVDQVPASLDLREILVTLYLATSQPAKAEEQMRKIVALSPSNLAARSLLARHLARTGNVEAAQQVLEDAVRDFSQSRESANADAAKLLLVDFVARERSREEGEKALRRFIAQDPGNADLQLGLGALLQRTGATTEAVGVYEEIIRHDGTGPKALVARDRVAALEFAAGHTEAARKLLADVLQKNPRDGDALLLRATIELREKDAAGAIADLRAVLRDQPNTPSLQRMLASAYVAKGELALAEETLRAALQLAPGEPQLAEDAAGFYEKQGRVDDAIAIYESLYRTNTRMQQFAANNLAMLLVTYKADRASLDRARDLTSTFASSKNGTLLDTVGWVRFKRGEYQDALAPLEQAVAAAPQSHLMRYHLAMDELRLGQRDRARTDLESALKGEAEFSGSEEARLALVRLSK